ncbi:hypothetical protein [Stakelama tenebrarum]|uniref:Uncharacterized protein n=1 Tax=Stakelama tenebrarum TaxID=2711215 RepID=A0A6G6Y0T8_9SPHN|nr:hypothetical protein [Sphingosinithalassobacter tenebrarum]QIG78328.1 hypothetical protein G5C33_11395 [Sphingosinithalassobacter tenebrarum]
MPQDNAPSGVMHSSGVASAEQGLVLLDGPDGVAISLTPEAAEETAKSLIVAAHAARSQAQDG